MAIKETSLQDTHKLFLEALRHREQEIFQYLAILVPALGGFLWLLHISSTDKPTANGPQHAVVQAVGVQPVVIQFASDPGGTTRPVMIQPGTIQPALIQPIAATLSATPQLTTGVFVSGTIGALLLLLLGAVYSLALGYNYRYITLQLAKLEGRIGIKGYMLEGWPRSRRQFLARYRLSHSIPNRIRRMVFGRFSNRVSYRRWLHRPWCTPPEIIKVFWWAFLLAMVGVAVAASVSRPVAMFGVMPVLIICLAVGWLIAPCRYGKKLYGQCSQEPKSWPADPIATTSGGGQTT